MIESGASSQIKTTEPFLDLNLRPYERGARTLPLSCACDKCMVKNEGGFNSIKQKFESLSVRLPNFIVNLSYLEKEGFK